MNVPYSKVNLCYDLSDCEALLPEAGIHLKPIAQLSVTVSLPKLKSGQSISNAEIIDKLSGAIKPAKFESIKVKKSTLEFIRFESEVSTKAVVDRVLEKIDQKGIKLKGFSDMLKIKASEAQIKFPTEHDWDKFFRDAKNMNGMKAGERPDTVILRNVPVIWFAQPNNPKRPSESIIHRSMERFGEIRNIDIPTNDPMRSNMPMDISGLTPELIDHKDVLFTAYVQFQEYIDFKSCMTFLRGKKLVYTRGDKAWSCLYEVDYDRTKHLTDACVKKRKDERERLVAQDKELQERMRLQNEKEMENDAILRLKEKDRVENKARDSREQDEDDQKDSRRRREERERRRREKKKRQLGDANDQLLNEKIAFEEKQLMVAQRKLQSIRLLDELLDRIRIVRRGGKKEDAKQEVEDDPERERLISHMLEKEEANMKMHHIEVTKAHMGQSRLSSILGGKETLENISSRSMSRSPEASLPLHPTQLHQPPNGPLPNHNMNMSGPPRMNHHGNYNPSWNNNIRPPMGNFRPYGPMTNSFNARPPFNMQQFSGGYAPRGYYSNGNNMMGGPYMGGGGPRPYMPSSLHNPNWNSNKSNNEITKRSRSKTPKKNKRESRRSRSGSKSKRSRSWSWSTTSRSRSRSNSRTGQKVSEDSKTVIKDEKSNADGDSSKKSSSKANSRSSKSRSKSKTSRSRSKSPKRSVSKGSHSSNSKSRSRSRSTSKNGSRRSWKGRSRSRSSRDSRSSDRHGSKKRRSRSISKSKERRVRAGSVSPTLNESDLELSSDPDEERVARHNRDLVLGHKPLMPDTQEDIWNGAIKGAVMKPKTEPVDNYDGHRGRGGFRHHGGRGRGWVNYHHRGRGNWHERRGYREYPRSDEDGYIDVPMKDRREPFDDRPVMEERMRRRSRSPQQFRQRERMRDRSDYDRPILERGMERERRPEFDSDVEAREPRYYERLSRSPEMERYERGRMRLDERIPHPVIDNRRERSIEVRYDDRRPEPRRISMERDYRKSGRRSSPELIEERRDRRRISESEVPIEGRLYSDRMDEKVDPRGRLGRNGLPVKVHAARETDRELDSSLEESRRKVNEVRPRQRAYRGRKDSVSSADEGERYGPRMRGPVLNDKTKMLKKSIDKTPLKKSNRKDEKVNKGKVENRSNERSRSKGDNRDKSSQRKPGDKKKISESKKVISSKRSLSNDKKSSSPVKTQKIRKTARARSISVEPPSPQSASKGNKRQIRKRSLSRETFTPSPRKSRRKSSVSADNRSPSPAYRKSSTKSSRKRSSSAASRTPSPKSVKTAKSYSRSRRSSPHRSSPSPIRKSISTSRRRSVSRDSRSPLSKRPKSGKAQRDFDKLYNEQDGVSGNESANHSASDNSASSADEHKAKKHKKHSKKSKKERKSKKRSKKSRK